jgi:hypothetical protein
MAESYRAILIDGRLRWLDDVPDAIRHGTEELRVRVAIEESKEQDEGELETLLDELAEADPYSDIEDPVAWQRRLRREDL